MHVSYYGTYIYRRRADTKKGELVAVIICAIISQAKEFFYLLILLHNLFKSFYITTFHDYSLITITKSPPNLKAFSNSVLAAHGIDVLTNEIGLLGTDALQLACSGQKEPAAAAGAVVDGDALAEAVAVQLWKLWL